jgi:hypothetical protein
MFTFSSSVVLITIKFIYATVQTSNIPVFTTRFKPINIVFTDITYSFS